MSHFFITAPSTDIGKTYWTERFLQYDQGQQKKYIGLKPLISGWCADQIDKTDTAKIIQAMDQSVTNERIREISPWRYTPAVAPDLAQRLEHRPLNFQTLVDDCKAKIAAAAANQQKICIEGVGGVMSPISHNKTVLDWIKALDLPSIMVTGTYLGAISHTLTCIKALEAEGIKIVAIILNESNNSPISLHETQRSLKQFTQHCIYPMHYQKPVPHHMATLYDYLGTAI